MAHILRNKADWRNIAITLIDPWQTLAEHCTAFLVIA
jgi:hypothetical protein